MAYPSIETVWAHLRIARRRSGPAIKPVEPESIHPPGFSEAFVELFDGFGLRESFLIGLGSDAAVARAVRIGRFIVVTTLRGDVVACDDLALEILGCDVDIDPHSLTVATASGHRGNRLRFRAVTVGGMAEVPEVVLAASGRRVGNGARQWTGGLPVLTPETMMAWVACTRGERDAFVAGSRLLNARCEFTNLDVAGSRRREEQVRADALARLTASGWREHRRARGVIEKMDGGCGSVPELEILWAFWDAGLYPATQHPIAVPGRDWPYVVDFAFLEERLIIEFDGWGKMGRDLEEVRKRTERDERRQKAIEDQAWFFRRFRNSDRKDMDAVIRSVKARLAEIRRLRGMA